MVEYMFYILIFHTKYFPYCDTVLINTVIHGFMCHDLFKFPQEILPVGNFCTTKERKTTRSKEYEYLDSFCTTAGLFCKTSLQVYNQPNISPSFTSITFEMIHFPLV